MVQSREVSKTEKIVFPVVVATFVILLLPSTAPLIGCLMLGNLFRECGVTDRLSDTAQNALMNIVTIFLATSVGATMVAQNFLNLNTIKIIILGLIAFSISTVGGLCGGIVMYKTSGGKINPLIGSAGVSAVPMAARVSQDVGRKYNKNNYLLRRRFPAQRFRLITSEKELPPAALFSFFCGILFRNVVQYD